MRMISSAQTRQKDFLKFSAIVKIDFRTTSVTEIKDINSRSSLLPCTFLAEREEAMDRQVYQTGFKGAF